MKKKAKNTTYEIDLEKLSKEEGLSLNQLNVKKKIKAMRTTFRLTDETIELLNELRKDRKLTDIFEQFGDFLTDLDKRLSDVVVKYLEGMDKKDLKNCEKKSFAISKKTVKIFNDLSKKNKVTRDAFVNGFIVFYHTLIKYFEKEDAIKVKQAQEKIHEFWGGAEKLQKELFEFLGEDHDLAKEFGYVNVMLMNLDIAIDEYLESGKPFEIF